MAKHSIFIVGACVALMACSSNNSLGGLGGYDASQYGPGYPTADGYTGENVTVSETVSFEATPTVPVVEPYGQNYGAGYGAPSYDGGGSLGGSGGSMGNLGGSLGGFSLGNNWVRNGLLGGLIGGATAYVVGASPWLGAGIGGVTGAGITYFEGGR